LSADSKHPVWHHYDCDSSACIEVAKLGEEFLIRDSKDPDGHTLKFSRDEWESFIRGIRAGDLPLD
jgi:hypothetical protein